jgi:hypothetical protein
LPQLVVVVVVATLAQEGLLVDLAVVALTTGPAVAVQQIKVEPVVTQTLTGTAAAAARKL